MTAKKIIKKYDLVDYFFLTIGSAIMALGIGVFLVDAKVVPGGVSGLSMALYYLSGHALPVGISMWVLNIPLYFWGLKELGKTFGIRTFFAFTINSIFIDLFRGEFPYIPFYRLQDSAPVQELMKQDFFFLILIGSVLLGVGLGIIFKFRGTTAGSDIVASIMQKKYGIKPGQAIMFIDFFVITLAGIIIGAKGLSENKHVLNLTLYAFFLLFISSWIIDLITDGFEYARCAYIFSDKNAEISEAITNDLGRGATGFKTRGVYRNVETEAIMTVITLKEISRLTEIVKEIDPDAFMTISPVHEVLGRGFRKRI